MALLVCPSRQPSRKTPQQALRATRTRASASCSLTRNIPLKNCDKQTTMLVAAMVMAPGRQVDLARVHLVEGSPTVLVDSSGETLRLHLETIPIRLEASLAVDSKALRLAFPATLRHQASAEEEVFLAITMRPSLVGSSGSSLLQRTQEAFSGSNQPTRAREGCSASQHPIQTQEASLDSSRLRVLLLEASLGPRMGACFRTTVSRSQPVPAFLSPITHHLQTTVRLSSHSSSSSLPRRASVALSATISPKLSRPCSVQASILPRHKARHRASSQRPTTTRTSLVGSSGLPLAIQARRTPAERCLINSLRRRRGAVSSTPTMRQAEGFHSTIPSRRSHRCLVTIRVRRVADCSTLNRNHRSSALLRRISRTTTHPGHCSTPQ